MLEILIVIAIIALLLAILLSSFGGVQQDAAKTVCGTLHYQMTVAQSASDECETARIAMAAYEADCLNEPEFQPLLGSLFGRNDRIDIKSTLQGRIDRACP